MKKIFFFLSLILSCSYSRAQIVYVAPQPGYQVHSYGYMNLDLDSNGINDFYISAGCGQVSGNAWQHDVLITPLGSNNAVAGDTSGYPTLYTNGILLDSTVNQWDSLVNPISETIDSYSGWYCGGTPSYIGVRFLIGPETHYGWIGVIVGSSCINIVDWAYNSQPDSSIATAQVWTNVSQVTQISPGIIAADHSIFIKRSENAPAIITAYDVTGQLLSRITSESEETRIDLPGLPAGIYFVEVREGGKSFTKKIFLQ